MRGFFSSVFGGASVLRPANDLQSSVALRWVSARREGLIFALLGVLAFGLTVYLCAPGYMGPDSRSQFQQARNFYFTDDHPVLMALIWHYLDRLVPGPLGMLVFTNALVWAGLSALFWVLPGPLAWRALGFVLVGFWPPGFSTLPIVYKDSLMHGAMLVAIAAVIPHTRRALVVRLALGVVCLLLAVGVRHNGAAAVWPFLALPFMRLSVVARLRPWLRLCVGSSAALVLAFATTRSVDRALEPLSHPTEFWQTVPVYDLAGMSVQAGKLLVDPDTQVFAQDMGLKQIQRQFRLDFGGTLYRCASSRPRCVPLFRYSVDRDELARLSQNWFSAIAEHPGAYLAHRWELTRAMLTVNTSGKELYWTSTAPHGEFAAQYAPSERLLGVLNFMERHIGFVAFSPWVYVVLGFVLLPLALRRYLRDGEPLPMAFLFSGGAYLVSNLVGASSTTYRYCVWTMMCTLLAVFAFARPKAQLAVTGAAADVRARRAPTAPSTSTSAEATTTQMKGSTM
jgi:hypothetical protein